MKLHETFTPLSVSTSTSSNDGEGDVTPTQLEIVDVAKRFFNEGAGRELASRLSSSAAQNDAELNGNAAQDEATSAATDGGGGKCVSYLSRSLLTGSISSYSFLNPSRAVRGNTMSPTTGITSPLLLSMQCINTPSLHSVSTLSQVSAKRSQNRHMQIVFPTNISTHIRISTYLHMYIPACLHTCIPPDLLLMYFLAHYTSSTHHRPMQDRDM